jgi:cysteinyl-tRNA synthetase
MDTVLGLKFAEIIEETEKWEETNIESIEEKIAERTAAKKAKDFAKADSIRAALKEQGIILEDGPTGTAWRKE